VILIRVRDYGKGVSTAVSGVNPSSLGVGIGGMRERLRQLGGELIVCRAEPGTSLEAKIPLFT